MARMLESPFAQGTSESGRALGQVPAARHRQRQAHDLPTSGHPECPLWVESCHGSTSSVTASGRSARLRRVRAQPSENARHSPVLVRGLIDDSLAVLVLGVAIGARFEQRYGDILVVGR